MILSSIKSTCALDVFHLSLNVGADFNVNFKVLTYDFVVDPYDKDEIFSHISTLHLPHYDLPKNTKFNYCVGINVSAFSTYLAITFSYIEETKSHGRHGNGFVSKPIFNSVWENQ